MIIVKYGIRVQREKPNRFDVRDSIRRLTRGADIQMTENSASRAAVGVSFVSGESGWERSARTKK